MWNKVTPLYEVIRAKNQLTETVAKGKQGFGDYGIVQLNEMGDGIEIINGPGYISLDFADAIGLRNLLADMLPEYHDSELLPPKAAESEAANG